MSPLRFVDRSRRLAAAALLLWLAAPAVAQDSMAPTYARVRQGAGDWRERGGHFHGGGFGYGFYQPFYYPPTVVGSWYQRPYPYHFDYYRYRWGGAAGTGPAPAEAFACPCETPLAPSPEVPATE
jgi:hypothetical protein